MVKKNNINNSNLIVQYLVASYSYYYLDDNIISDIEFDKLARKIYNEWDLIEHPYKAFIDKESLETSSTAFYIKEIDYPEQIKDYALKLTNQSRKYPIAYHNYDKQGWTIPNTGRKIL